jgi:hypothetical protein
MSTSARPGAGTRGTAWRLACTVWLVYAIHFSSNVVRETYLSVALAERFTVRVDEYTGLHPDLFEIPGRGAYINNNPGASFLGAIPYFVARPALEALFAWKPSLLAPKPAASYDDPRPNRTKFMNAARTRGLDIKLGLAALITHLGLMVPLGALATVLVFRFLHGRLRDERVAMWLALLFAFGTPQFFRAAFLNQNAILAHLVLGSYIAMVGWTPRPEGAPVGDRALLLVGLLLGFGLVCDYSAIPLLLVFGFWIMADGWRRGGPATSVRDAAVYTAGALAPIALLFLYQWAAFGHPLHPAQRYMPPTEFSVRGWFGMSPPSADLLWRNLFDPRYGLFAFSPMLLGAFGAPFLRERPGGPTRAELGWSFAALAGLWLFSSMNQFANLQWNTGVRYMVPAAPLLFLALVPVLLRSPAWLRWLLIVPTLVISWCVSMTREDIPRALRQVFTSGPELPVTIVLDKMASGYPELAAVLSPLPVFAATAIAVWLVWRGWRSA